MTSPKPNTISVWTSLVTANNNILDEIESALSQAKLPKLGWYDALLEIEKAGPDGIRPYELKERLLLPQYGTSRLLERLEKEGMVERQAVAQDGRGQIIRLTDRGRATRQEMWPVYAASLKGSVEDKLTDREAEELARLLGKLKKSAG